MINEIIITNLGGVILYYKNFKEDILDSDLISGFFAAIQQFADHISTSLEEIKLGSKIYTFLATDKIYLAIQTDITQYKVKKAILQNLKTQFEDKFREELNRPLVDTDNFRNFNEVIDIVCSNENIAQLIIKNETSEEEPEEMQKSLLLLFNLIKKDLDKVIYALILGDSVIVTGDKALVKLAIDTLALFTFNRAPEIIYWTKEYTIGDIVGGPPILTDVYKTGVIVDLKNSRVIRGKSNNFCKKLLTQIQNLDWISAERVIKTEFQKISSKSTEIIEMITQKNIDSAQIDNYIADIELDDIEFLEIHTKLKNPHLLNELEKIFSEIQKKKSKILRGFQKQTW